MEAEQASSFGDDFSNGAQSRNALARLGLKRFLLRQEAFYFFKMKDKNMTLKNLWQKLVSPSSQDEVGRNREIILNFLLLLSSAGFLVLNVIRFIDLLSLGNRDRGLSIFVTLAIMLFFLGLLWLSKKGFARIAAWLLITVYSLPMFYCYISWGADLPAALLLTVLIITLCGILISARWVLISTAAINLFLIILTYCQTMGIANPNSYWRLEKHELGDAITYAILFMFIASVAWLSCRGIRRALDRAQKSEADLKKERDSLEIKVLERTNELRQLEAEKISQLYRLAEFGRLSTGIFHDLLNPLTAISLNLEQVEIEGDPKIFSAKSYLNQAILATRKMENLITSIKKQIQCENSISFFSLNKEIEQTLEILAYQARRAKVKISFIGDGAVQLTGDAVKFGQIITNLLANAIEACEGGQDKEVKVEIRLVDDSKKIFLRVTDNGCGIAPENLVKIFYPFFSTKKGAGRGLGIGLSSTKNLVEKDFGGQITVKSLAGQGTEFLVSLPTNYENRDRLSLAGMAA